MNSENKPNLSYLIIAYIPLLFIPLLLLSKNSNNENKTLITNHAKQGFIINVFGLVMLLLNALHSNFLFDIIPITAFVTIGYSISVIWILWLTLIVKGMTNVLKEQHRPLPLIGKFLWKHSN